MSERQEGTMVHILFVAGILTGTSSVPVASADPFAVTKVSFMTKSGPKTVGLPFALIARRSQRTWTMKPAPPVSAHRDDEDGPVILTEKGPLRCRGHRFNAANVYQADPGSHRSEPVK
jgi:hypothetical protein